MYRFTLLLILVCSFISIVYGMQTFSAKVELNSVTENLKDLLIELEHAISESPSQSIFHTRCHHAKGLAEALLKVSPNFTFEHLRTLEKLHAHLNFFGYLLSLSEKLFNAAHSTALLGSLRFDSQSKTTKSTLKDFFLINCVEKCLSSLIKDIQSSTEYSSYDNIHSELRRRLSLINLELANIYYNRMDFFDQMAQIQLSDKLKVKLQMLRSAISVYHKEFQGKLIPLKGNFLKLFHYIYSLSLDESSFYSEYESCLEFFRSHGFPSYSLHRCLLESLRSNFQIKIFAHSFVSFIGRIIQFQDLFKGPIISPSILSPMLDIAIEDDFSDAFFKNFSADLSKEIEDLNAKYIATKKICDEQAILKNELVADIAALDKDLAVYNKKILSEREIMENKKNLVKCLNEIQRDSKELDRKLNYIPNILQYFAHRVY
jgi:hypothetical protein